jgi:hypothetical protein
LFKTCICKESHGRYTDYSNAQIGGKGIPIGIDNRSFVNAVRGRKQEGKGTSFDAFVVPVNCKTVKDMENK